MKSIAFWANRHRWTARILIITFTLLLNAIAFVLGNILSAEGFFVNPLWMYATASVALATFFAYPSAKNKIAYRLRFTKRKFCDAILLACTFCTIVLAGNQNNAVNALFHLQPAAYAVQPIPPATQKPPVTTISKKEKKTFIKNLKKEIRGKYKKMSTGSKIALIALAVALAIIVGYGVAALACSIMCSGAEALGTVVLILGWGGIIILLVHVISRITKGPKKKKVATEPVPG